MESVIKVQGLTWFPTAHQHSWECHICGSKFPWDIRSYNVDLRDVHYYLSSYDICSKTCVMEEAKLILAEMKKQDAERAKEKADNEKLIAGGKKAASLAGKGVLKGAKYLFGEEKKSDEDVDWQAERDKADEEAAAEAERQRLAEIQRVQELKSQIAPFVAREKELRQQRKDEIESAQKKSFADFNAKLTASGRPVVDTNGKVSGAFSAKDINDIEHFEGSLLSSSSFFEDKVNNTCYNISIYESEGFAQPDDDYLNELISNDINDSISIAKSNALYEVASIKGKECKTSIEYCEALKDEVISLGELFPDSGIGRSLKYFEERISFENVVNGYLEGNDKIACYENLVQAFSSDKVISKINIESVDNSIASSFKGYPKTPVITLKQATEKLKSLIYAEIDSSKNFSLRSNTNLWETEFNFIEERYKKLSSDNNAEKVILLSIMSMISESFINKKLVHTAAINNRFTENAKPFYEGYVTIKPLTDSFFVFNPVTLVKETVSYFTQLKRIKSESRWEILKGINKNFAEKTKFNVFKLNLIETLKVVKNAVLVVLIAGIIIYANSGNIQAEDTKAAFKGETAEVLAEKDKKETTLEVDLFAPKIIPASQMKITGEFGKYLALKSEGVTLKADPETYDVSIKFGLVATGNVKGMIDSKVGGLFPGYQTETELTGNAAYDENDNKFNPTYIKLGDFEMKYGRDMQNKTGKEVEKVLKTIKDMKKGDSADFELKLKTSYFYSKLNKKAIKGRTEFISTLFSLPGYDMDISIKYIVTPYDKNGERLKDSKGNSEISSILIH